MMFSYITQVKTYGLLPVGKLQKSMELESSIPVRNISGFFR
jgi:hypothetical protein